MVAVVAGSGLGLVNTTRELGAGGPGGAAVLDTGSLGRAGEQVSVNASTGNLVIRQRDEFVAGIGEDLSLLRTYNSLGGWDGDNNDAWRIGFYRRVSNLTGTLNTAGSTVTRIEADGFESIYTYDAAAGCYVGKDGAGAYDRLSFSSGVWTWTDGDSGTTERYELTGTGASGTGTYRLAQVTDISGHAIKIGYDAAGLINTIASWAAGASSASEQLTLTYDANRRLTQLSTSTRDAQGTLVTQIQVRYEYDASGRLEYVRTNRSPEDNSTADGRQYSVRYGYDSAGRVNRITQSHNSSLGIEYDSAGRVWRLTDALNRVTTFTYDTTARQTTITDTLGQVSLLAYDTAGRLTEVSGAAIGTSLTQKNRFSYDADGNLITSRNALNQE